MHTSATRTMSGNASFSALKPVQTGPFASQAPVPSASLWSGMPNRIRERTPALYAVRASSTRLSTESCATPGMEAMGLRTPRPDTANSGSMKSLGDSSVSRTSWRSVSVRRRRRGRSAGKALLVARERSRPSRSRLPAHAERDRVLAGFEQERLSGPAGGIEYVRAGIARVPAGEIVPDVDGRFGADVERDLQAEADLAGVGEVAEIALRGIGEGDEGALEVSGYRDQGRQPVLQLDVRGDPEQAHP